MTTRVNKAWLIFYAKKNTSNVVIGTELESYVNGFMTFCKAQDKKKSNGTKRKKSAMEIAETKTKHQKTDSLVPQDLSQRNIKSDPKCSRCGEAFSTGHHRKNNCPNECMFAKDA